jgi:hypothetical protein
MVIVHSRNNQLKLSNHQPFRREKQEQPTQTEQPLPFRREKQVTMQQEVPGTSCCIVTNCFDSAKFLYHSVKGYVIIVGL